MATPDHRGFVLDLAVMRALATNGGMTAVELGDRIGTDPVTIGRVCRHLQREESIHITATGECQLTAAGRGRLRTHRRLSTDTPRP
ncbi:MAG: hypothetical protein ABEJ57_06635 [Halobacteriaceae archaeon]